MLAFLRFLAGAFFLVAVIAAVGDGTRTLATGVLTTTSLLEHWTAIAPGLLAAARSGVARVSHPLVWELGLRKVLLLPTWAVFLTLGLLFAYAGRRRRRINVYAN